MSASDLKKHEKTQSRPWKCPVESCKYHEYGWPTEKEMKKHRKDKHSATPPFYECHFKRCPYQSKRESNCKQHMEKAHGWEFVRSKNNGKNRRNGVLSNTSKTSEEDEFDMQSSDDGFDIGEAIPQHRANVERVVALDRTPGGFSADLKTGQFHRDVLALETMRL